MPIGPDLDMWCCSFMRQWNDMEMHAVVYAEIHQPITDQIEHCKGILGVGVSIQVEPYGVFPLYKPKGRLRIDSRDAGLGTVPSPQMKRRARPRSAPCVAADRIVRARTFRLGRARAPGLFGEKGPGVHDLRAIGIGSVSQRHELRSEGLRLLSIARQLGGAGGTGEGAKAVWHSLE